QAVQAGPSVAASNLTAYLTAETAGLLSAEVTANSITHAWSGGAKNLAGGVLLRGRTLTGKVVGTPTIDSTGATILIPTITSVAAGSDLVAIVVARNGQTTVPVIATSGMTGAGWT